MTLTQIALTISAGFIYTFVCYSANRYSIKAVVNSKTIFGLLFLLSLVSSEFYSFILWFSLGSSITLYIQLKLVNPLVELFTDKDGNIDISLANAKMFDLAIHSMALQNEVYNVRKEYSVTKNQTRKQN